MNRAQPEELDLDRASLKKRSHPPEPPSQEELRAYAGRLKDLGAATSESDAHEALDRWQELFVSMWKDHQQSVGDRRARRAASAPHPASPDVEARGPAVEEDGYRDPAAPYLPYISAMPQTGPGQPGWKLRFAWACAIDGFDPKCAAMFEDAAVRSTPSLRSKYAQWLLSDPGHERYVVKRWKTEFRSLFDNLAPQDQELMRKYRLARAEDWIGDRGQPGKPRNE